jgi:hypothetical protein
MKEEDVRIFIDAIEDDEAVVLLGETRHRFPRALLPAGAKEGSWLSLSVDRSPQAQEIGEEIEARRARLLRSDPGGNIKL